MAVKHSGYFVFTRCLIIGLLFLIEFKKSIIYNSLNSCIKNWCFMKLFIFLLGFFLSLQDSFAMTPDDALEGKPAANPSIPRIGFRYLDKEEENLFSLSTHFTEQAIEAYNEDLLRDANKSLQVRKQQNPDITKKDIAAIVSQTIVEDIYRVGKNLYNRVNPGDSVVILGRSPVFVGFALEHFLSQDPKDINLIDLLYSGTPNISRIRDYEVDDRRNVLTPDRLRFFENYMDKQGFSKITSPEQRVFIVDQMGSGASMNVFLRILRHYFTSKGMKDLPQITVLLMNFQSKEIHKQGTGYYLFNAERETLSFASAVNTKDRSRSLMVHALPLDIPNIVVDACDDGMDE